MIHFSSKYLAMNQHREKLILAFHKNICVKPTHLVILFLVWLIDTHTGTLLIHTLKINKISIYDEKNFYFAPKYLFFNIISFVNEFNSVENINDIDQNLCSENFRSKIT